MMISVDDGHCFEFGGEGGKRERESAREPGDNLERGERMTANASFNLSSDPCSAGGNPIRRLGSIREVTS